MPERGQGTHKHTNSSSGSETGDTLPFLSLWFLTTAVTASYHLVNLVGLLRSLPPGIPGMVSHDQEDQLLNYCA